MSKYRAVPTFVHGRRFDSKREAARYSELLLLGRAKVIQNLELQPSFSLSGVATYRADFAYDDLELQQRMVEDVKGFDTAISRLKRKLVQAQYGIAVKVVR